MRRTARLALAIGALVAGVLAACGSDDTPDDAVHLMRADGTVGPIMERYISRGIERAEENQATLVVIELDTPGGLVSSMEDIVRRIDSSSVPVAVYVSPNGARAASAGTFMTMAGHVAAMAPNTVIGAAAAINSDGSDIEGTAGEKIENYNAALIRNLAEARGRNADWAEDAVREAVAATSSEALELDVVDYVATDVDDLLSQVDGTTIALRPGVDVTFSGLTEAERVRTDLTAWERFLEVIADPNVASILLTLGFLGLVFELSSPGTILPGTFGIIAIILGFLGFGVLPVETAGLILIAIALALFALELFVPSGGILGIGGIIALILGGIIAFRDTPAEFQPSRILVVALVIVVSGMFVSLAIGLARLRNVDLPVGSQAMVGMIATARTPLRPAGQVAVMGERWQAQIERGEAQPGDRLRVIAAEGLRLTVRKEEQHDPARPE